MNHNSEPYGDSALPAAGRAAVFPHNIGLGASRDLNRIERVARATAEELVATGVNWNYAPGVTIPRDIRWGPT